MPKYPGIYSKKLKSTTKYFGSKWYAGRTYNTSLYTTAREAYEALQQLVRELEAGIRKDKRSITVGEFILLYQKDYLDPKQITDQSKSLFISSLKNAIIPLIGDRRLQSLTPVDMQRLQNELLVRYKDTTADWHIKIFHGVLKRAVIWDYLVRDPMIGLDPIRRVKHKPETLTPEEISLIVYDERFPLRDRCLVGLGGFAGLRISEAVAVKRQNIDFSSSSIYIDVQFCNSVLKPPKTGKCRYVPILPDFDILLKEMYIKSIGPWLFPGVKRDKPITPSSWTSSYFRSLLRELGLPQVRFHSLRHSFNQMLLDMGIPTREVMQIMGHKSIGMHWHYDRESVQRLVQVTRSIKTKRA